jgi:hypothetical protein
VFLVCVKEAFQRCDYDGYSARQQLAPNALGNAIAPHMIWAVNRHESTRLTVTGPAAGQTGMGTFHFQESALKPVNSQLPSKMDLIWTVSSCFRAPLSSSYWWCNEAIPHEVQLSIALEIKGDC